MNCRQQIFLLSFFLNAQILAADHVYTIVLSEDRYADEVYNIVEQAFLDNQSPDQIHITSLTAHALIVPKGTVLDIAQLGNQIVFSGNAHLVLEPGARIQGTNSRMKFTERSGMRIQGH